MKSIYMDVMGSPINETRERSDIFEASPDAARLVASLHKDLERSFREVFQAAVRNDNHHIV